MEYFSHDCDVIIAFQLSHKYSTPYSKSPFSYSAVWRIWSGTGHYPPDGGSGVDNRRTRAPVMADSPRRAHVLPYPHRLYLGLRDSRLAAGVRRVTDREAGRRRCVVHSAVCSVGRV